MANTNRYNKMKVKRSKKSKIVLFIIVPFLVLLSISGVYAGYLYNKVKETAKESFEPIPERETIRAESEKRNENVSILFMGVDESDVRNFGDAVRTDALILATLNKKQKSVNLVSIPRDTLVYLPFNKDDDKINHAHVFGGVKGTIETVEYLFDIPVDYYVKLNFYAFIDLVEALDGIEVDVPVTISEKDSRDINDAIKLTKGLQILNGEEALALARTRKIDNDIERGKRQQIVMEAIMKKAISLGSITKYGEMIEAIGTNMTTDMKFENMKSFYNYALGGNLTVNSLLLEGNNHYIGKTYYYKLEDESLESVSDTLKSHLEVSALTNNNSNISATEDSSEDSL